MNCTICGSPTGVLATRVVSAARLRRRRMCEAHGHRFWTSEVLESVGLDGDDLQRAARGAERRRKAFETRQAVAAREGVKATAVAHELGITEARVRQIRKELQCAIDAARGSSAAPSARPASWFPC